MRARIPPDALRHLIEYAPNYDAFDDWHDRGSVRCWYGNCYAYALDLPEHAAIHTPPGDELDSPKKLAEALRADGWRKLYRHTLRSPRRVRRVARQPGHLIAAAFGRATVPNQLPRTDYHFYRLDSNGTWSHKHGDEIAAKTDESDAIIEDPGATDRGEYPSFVGYWWVDHRQLGRLVRGYPELSS